MLRALTSSIAITSALALVVPTWGCAPRDERPPPMVDAGPPPPPPDAGVVGPTLSIEAIDPDFGPQEGGQLVTIYGSGFQDGLVAALGGTTLDDLFIIDDRSFEAYTPAALLPGLADLVVVNPDGQRARLTDAYLFEAPPPLAIAACSLVAEPRVSTGAGDMVSVRGRVGVVGKTDGPGRADGLRVEAGYGFPGFAPPSWTWFSARYTGDADGAVAGDRAQDEYEGTFTVPLPGTYRVATRVSGDGGRSWSYCDRDGLANGFSEAQATELTVRLRQVGECVLESDARLSVAPGDVSSPIALSLYALGITDAAGQGAGVRVELGFGPVGETPIAPAWSWANAGYIGDASGPQGALARDRYEGTVRSLDAGVFDLAARVSLDAGRTWTYCDRDGAANGYSSAQAARLSVSAEAGGVDRCQFLAPARVDVVLGEVSPVLRGEIYEAGITPGVGRGEGLLVQVGYGPVTAAPGGPSWRFVDAVYGEDGNTGGAAETDVYLGTLTAQLPGEYAMAFRASRDDGASWTYCDLNGSQDGFDLGAQTARLFARPVGVGECATSAPASTESVVGVPALFAGRVFVAARTPGAGQGGGVRAQLGFGLENADPTTWTWTDAPYTRDVDGPASGDLSRDEYALSVTPTSGTYRVAYRFSVDGGVAWTMCDRNGSADGFRVTDAAQLVVRPLSVGACRLDATANSTTLLGSSVGPLGATVFVDGRTPGAGRGANVRVELGYGPPNELPSASAWRFFNATYSGDVDGAASGDRAQDRYEATLVTATLGTFALAARASVDDGATWTACDLDGSQNGFDLAQTPRVTVVPPGPPFGACRLEAPTRVVAVEGTQTVAYGASVLVAGVTESAGAGAGVTGELGYGPTGVAPTDPRWVWSAATYRADTTFTALDDADFYDAVLVAPAPGAYDVAARFSVNGGVTYHVCDLDGSANGYSQDEASELITRRPIASCALQFPQTLQVVSGAESGLVFGRVRVPGVTDGAGQGPDVLAELGYGPLGSEPDAPSWQWSPAEFNAPSDGQDFDEYMARLRIAAPTGGTFSYTLRFSADEGRSWCYGRGVGGALGGATVTPVTIADARIQAPAVIRAMAGIAAAPIYVQVDIPGYTLAQGPPTGEGAVVARVVYGPVGGTPPTAFTGALAQHNALGPEGAYDEFVAQLPPLAAGDYDLAAGFTLPGGAAEVFGDLDGSAMGGYSAAMAKRLLVRAPAGGTVGYCATQFPLALDVVMSAAGGQSAVVYGRVFKAGVTQGAGWGAGVIGQLGHGPMGSAPDTWTTWRTAEYARDVDGLSSGDLANDEYESVLVLTPGTTGPRDFAYRFTADGATWTYCGLAPTGSGGAFTAGTATLR